MDRVIVVPSHKRSLAFRRLAEYYSAAYFFNGRYVCCSGTLKYTELNSLGWIGNISEQQIIVGEARNIAMAKAFAQHGEDAIYFQSDDDTTMQPKYLNQMFEFMEENPDCGLCMPGTHRGYDWKILKHLAVGETMDCWTPFRCVFTNGKLVARIGYHDPALHFKEDTDYAIRAVCAGFTTLALKLDDKGKTMELMNGYDGIGGVEVAAASEPRAKANEEGARYIEAQYPFAEINAQGRLNWCRRLKRMEKAGTDISQWARYVKAVH